MIFGKTLKRIGNKFDYLIKSRVVLMKECKDTREKEEERIEDRIS
jgi:hypothetical protein